MKVRCVRTQLAFHVEKLTGLREMHADALDVHTEYAVLGLNFQKETNIYRAHISFIILVDIFVLGLFHEDFFEITDPRIPHNWEYRPFDETSIIQPSLFYEPSFSEHLFEGDLSARQKFKELLETLDHDE